MSWFSEEMILNTNTAKCELFFFNIWYPTVNEAVFFEFLIFEFGYFEEDL
jgi:hypothetical protein